MACVLLPVSRTILTLKFQTMLLFSIEDMKKDDERILSEGKVTWGDEFDKLQEELREYEQLLALPDRFFDTEENLKDQNCKTYGTRQACLARYHEIERKVTDLMIASSNIDSEALEKVANEIKTWKTDLDQVRRDKMYPWEDVALNILKYPREVELNYDKCPVCGNPRIKLWFCSPQWTWAKNCGRSGEMIICMECKKQSELRKGVIS